MSGEASHRFPEGDWPAGYLASVERFLAEDYLRPNGGDVHDDLFRSDWFFPLQRRREHEKMLRVARKLNPTTLCEIGADKGGSVYAWCKSLPSLRNVIACEIRGTPYDTAMERAFPHIDFLWLPYPSRGTILPQEMPVTQLVQEWLGRRKIDVLFIDGDKNAFQEDFDAYRPMMARPSVVFMHDINADTPTAAYVRTVRAGGYRHEEIIDTSEVAEEMAKEGPPTCPHGGWVRHWCGRSCGVGCIFLD